MNPAVIPKWLLEEENLTSRGWKQRKRRELRQAIKAMEHVRLGCAYTPNVDGVSIGEIMQHLNKLSMAWSQKEWGK
jgi:hypothetical protein